MCKSYKKKGRGFVTIAVGGRHYYDLALNLLKSYHYVVPEDGRYPFAIIADKSNEYTSCFDKQIIVENLPASYMSKLEMLEHPPFAETIFIDADCLVYNDIGELWSFFEGKNGLGIFGHKLSLSDEKGWFKQNEIGEWRKQSKFNLVTHGGIMYFRDDELTKAIYNTALQIIPHYSEYKFQIFRKPADEPILALSMSVHGCEPVEYSGEACRAYCFLPVRPNVRMNIRKNYLCYDHNWCTQQGMILHWQNSNTHSPRYKREVDRMTLSETKVTLLYILRSIVYFYTDKIPQLVYYVKACLFNIFDKLGVLPKKIRVKYRNHE